MRKETSFLLVRKRPIAHICSMKADINTLEGCRRTVAISADWEEVSADYCDIIDEFKAGDVQGFRPGKAPAAIVEKRFAQEISEAFNERAVRRLLRVASEENSLGPVGFVEARDVAFKKGDSYAFTAEFDVAPSIELPDYKTFQAAEEATDAEARDQLSEYLLQNASFVLPASLIDEELRAADDTPASPAQASPDQKHAAEQRVRLMLILRQIASQDGIEVDERDVDERITRMADSCGVREDALRTELLQKNGMPRLSLFLLAEQTMDYILELNP